MEFSGPQFPHLVMTPHVHRRVLPILLKAPRMGRAAGSCVGVGDVPIRSQPTSAGTVQGTRTRSPRVACPTLPVCAAPQAR